MLLNTTGHCWRISALSVWIQQACSVLVNSATVKEMYPQCSFRNEKNMAEEVSEIIEKVTF